MALKHGVYMNFSGEQIYFWNLKGLIQQLRTQPLTPSAQRVYLSFLILSSPLISFFSSLTELWSWEWYFIFSALNMVSLLLGLIVCARAYNPACPNGFLNCLVALSWVVGVRLISAGLAVLTLLLLIDQCEFQLVNFDSWLASLNRSLSSPYELVAVIIIWYGLFFGLVTRAIKQVGRV